MKIIAEAGCNHNGDISKALELIDVAKESGADYVKFQAYKTESLLLPGSMKAKYQARNTSKKETQFQRLKKAELSLKQFIKLYDYSKKRKIKLISSFFDKESLEVLKYIDMDYIKISSSEINNTELLKHISNTKNNVIFSTGMANINEINSAVKILKKNNLSKKIVCMHCVSSYPTKLSDSMLGLIPELKKALNIPIGFSDHTEGNEASISAIALGVEYLEKHFTLNKNMSGGDHKFSLNPNELKKYVQAIKDVSKSLSHNNFNKRVHAEKEISKISKRSICSKKNIKKGDKILKEDLCLRRPGNGLNPDYLKIIIGKKAKKDIVKDRLLNKSMF